jgi:hypothetical protein
MVQLCPLRQLRAERLGKRILNLALARRKPVLIEPVPAGVSCPKAALRPAATLAPFRDPPAEDVAKKFCNRECAGPYPAGRHQRVPFTLAFRLKLAHGSVNPLKPQSPKRKRLGGVAQDLPDNPLFRR